MKNTSFGIIGLGKFGSVVANDLILQGKTVIIADKDEQALKELQDKVSCAFVLDSTNIAALKEAGFADIDLVVVSIGENVEKSILTAMALKEIGVPNIIAKATSNIHGQILSKLGATKVIYPEKESAKRLVKELVSDIDFEVIDLSANTVCAVKIIVSDKLIGHSLGQIAGDMKTVAYKKKGSNEWQMFPELETTLVDSGDGIILVGTKKDLENLQH